MSLWALVASGNATYKPAEANLLLFGMVIMGVALVTSATIWRINRKWFAEYLASTHLVDTDTWRGKLKHAGIIYILRIIPVFSLLGFLTFFVMYQVCIG